MPRPLPVIHVIRSSPDTFKTGFPLLRCFVSCVHFFFFKVSESTYLIIEGFWSMLTKAFHTSKLTFSYIVFAVFIFQGYNWNLLYYER